MKYDLKAPAKDEEAYEVFNLGWAELAQELESLRKHCSGNKNPEYNIDEVIITPVESSEKIQVELTEDQVSYIEQLLERDTDIGDDSIGAEPDKAYNAFIRRILTKLAKAKTV